MLEAGHLLKRTLLTSMIALLLEKGLLIGFGFFELLLLKPGLLSLHAGAGPFVFFQSLALFLDQFFLLFLLKIAGPLLIFPLGHTLNDGKGDGHWLHRGHHHPQDGGRLERRQVDEMFVAHGGMMPLFFGRVFEVMARGGFRRRSRDR